MFGVEKSIFTVRDAENASITDGFANMAAASAEKCSDNPGHFFHVLATNYR
jgi:hypothetical protein